MLANAVQQAKPLDGKAAEEIHKRQEEPLPQLVEPGRSDQVGEEYHKPDNRQGTFDDGTHGTPLAGKPWLARVFAKN